MAFDEYDDPKELAKVQELSKKLLIEFDRVCKKINTPYVAWAGTALGAVRHQGFIPWDDDVDVAMLREDYERFIVEAPAVIGDEFEIVNMRNEPNFVSMVTYLTLKDTVFIPSFFDGCKYKKPLSIDIDPLDNLPDSEEAYKKQNRRSWIWGRLIFLSAGPKPYLPFGGFKKKLVNAACALAVFGMKVLRLTPVRLQKKWDAAVTEYDDTKTKYVADYADRNPYKWRATPDELFPALEMPFEDTTIMVPKEYDVILKRNYGNYMELPPVEQRKNHRPSQLDFGPY